MLHDKDFDKLLRTRYFESPDKNLTTRIIDDTKPHRIPAIKAVGDWVQRYTIFTHPGYAAALCIIIGILTGTQLPDMDQTTTIDNNTNIALFENSFIITTENEASNVN
jgi:hypothetical protein